MHVLNVCVGGFYPLYLFICAVTVNALKDTIESLVICFNALSMSIFIMSGDEKRMN